MRMASTGIYEVWEDNLDEVMVMLRELVEQFPYLSMVSSIISALLKHVH